jgi:chlorophyllide a reductase subunit X
MDFLGDVVCGGFATPLARSLSEEVILVTSNDRQSIFTSNNICQANNYFRTIGGRSRLLGLIVNRDDGSGMAESYAKAAGINVLMKVPYNIDARDMDDSFDFAVRLPAIGEPFKKLATDILDNAITPCEASGLGFGDFVKLFGEVSNESPVAASADELFRRNAASIGETEAHDPERQRLLECIEQLPEAEREIFTLLEVEGKSPEQIAELKGLGEKEVRTTIASARKAMRKLFFEQ